MLFSNYYFFAFHTLFTCKWFTADKPSVKQICMNVCRIRASTLERLHDLTDGALSRIMRQVTADDPIAPLLAEPHFKAMDRRLAIVLHAIDDFVRESSMEAVLVTDGFS